MSYDGMGLTFTTSAFTPSSPVPAVAPNAWRAALSRDAVSLANATAVGGRQWAAFVTQLVRIASMSSSATPEAILASMPVEPFYTGVWNPAWPGDMFTRAKNGVASLKSLVTAALPSAPVAPTMSVRLPTAPALPPATTVRTPEVECTDGYIRDAAGLCVPGAAPPLPGAVTQLPLPGSMPDGSGTPLVVPGPDASLATPVSRGPLGVSLKWWGLGAAGLTVGALLLRSSKNVSPNSRRRRRRRS